MLKKDTFENIFQDSKYPVNFTNESELSTFPLHWHNYVEIIRADRSGICYEINGHSYTLAKNDFLFIWPGELHALIYQPRPSYVQLLQFDYAFLSQRPDFQKISFLFHALRHIESEKQIALSQALGNLFDTLQKIFFSADNFLEVKCCMVIYEFFISVGEHLLSASSPCQQKKVTLHSSQVTERMISICSYLSLHCNEAITLDTAAQKAGFSKYHFSRLFKEFTNDSFTDFIIKERLRNAEELLHNTSLSITDVALQSGFNSISTFNRVFRKQKHCSPSQFRSFHFIS